MDCTFVNTDRSRLEDWILTFFLLLLVIAHSFDGRIAQDKAGRDVDEAHDGHEDIGNIPDSSHGHTGADEDDEDADNTEGIDETVGWSPLVDKTDAVIDVEQVADERREAEEEHTNRNQERAETTEDGCRCMLDVSSTSHFLGDGHA